MKRNNSKSAIVFQTIVTVLTLILLSHPLAALFDKILVTPIFSKIPDHWFTQIIVVALCGILLYKFWGRKVLTNYLPLGIISLAFYLSQRIITYWNFHTLADIHWLYLWDLVIITMVLVYLKDLTVKDAGDIENKNTSLWIEDTPVEKINEDTFQRKHYAKELSQQIETMYSKGSFAIGILGEYGSGKTSFINLIRNRLDKKRVEIIEFNAWKSEKSDHIQRDFFDHLSNELSDKDNNLSGLLTSYSRKLSRIDSSVDKFFKRAGLITQMINKIETEADEYERINKVLEKSKKKLVIVIDDMDRLYSNEVIEVLRLVRNTANFTNTVYLLAYEKSYIQKAIKEELHVDNRTPFMDKIVQMEVPLPKREQQDLIDLLKKLLHERVEKSEIETLEKFVLKYGFHKEWDYTFHEIFRNARDVIKFINSFLISYSLLKNEVLFDKLFLIELLKYRYPLFYERLYQRREDFLVIKEKRKSYQGYYIPLEIKESNVEEAKDGKKYAFSKYLKEENMHLDDIRIIRGLMQAMFNDFSWSNRSIRSIVYPSSFERYFRFRLSSSEISDFEFQKAWKSSYPAMAQYIRNCADNNLTVELTNHLFMTKPDNKDEFDLLVKSLFLIGTFYTEGKNNLHFDFDALIELLWNHQGLPAERFYRNNENQYIGLLKDLFLNAYFPFKFHCELISRINDSGQKVPLSQKELIDYQIIHFREYVRVKGLDATAIELMWTIRLKTKIYANGKVQDNIYLFVDELKPILQEYLQQYDLTEFLKGSIKKEHAGNGYTIYPSILDLFEFPDKLCEIIMNSERTDQNVKIEFINFYDQLSIIGFVNFVNFDFETELKPKSNEVT